MPRTMLRQSVLMTSMIGRLHDGAALLDLVEYRRLRDLGADDQADSDEHDACQEGNAPGKLAAKVHADEEDEVRQEQANGEAGLHDAGVLALGFPGCVLVAHQDGAAPFRAEGQALDHADEHQQGRGEQAHLLVGGQEADEERGHAHEDQRGHQHGLAADLVAEVTADDAADGPGGEAHAEGGEGGQGAGHRVAGGEERRSEVQGRGGAEADEVIGLNDCANTGADGDALGVLRAVHVAPHFQSFVAHG